MTSLPPDSKHAASDCLDQQLLIWTQFKHTFRHADALFYLDPENTEDLESMTI